MKYTIKFTENNGAQCNENVAVAVHWTQAVKIMLTVKYNQIGITAVSNMKWHI